MKHRSAAAIALYGSLAAGALVLAGWAVSVFGLGNIHTISAGHAYRSAQLDSTQLASAVHEYGIRTVINLRGANPGESWFDEELATSAALGVKHLDIRLSANEELSEAQISDLVGTMRSVPGPFLVHCNGGADRTGLAAALYRLDVEHASPEDAATQLTPRFGHVPWLFGRGRAMDRSFEREVAHVTRLAYAGSGVAP